jgi:hypothetical protein
MIKVTFFLINGSILQNCEQKEIQLYLDIFTIKIVSLSYILTTLLF